MDIDANLLKKLSELSDEELREALETVAAALGTDKKSVARASANIGMVRRKLERATDEDIKRAVDAVGEENAKELARRLKGELR